MVNKKPNGKKETEKKEKKTSFYLWQKPPLDDQPRLPVQVSRCAQLGQQESLNVLSRAVHRLAQLREVGEDRLLGALAGDLRRLHERAALLSRQLRVVGTQRGEHAVEELGVGVVAVGAGPGEGGRGGDGRGRGGGGRSGASGARGVVAAGFSSRSGAAAPAGPSLRSSFAHAAGGLPEGGVGARRATDAPLLLGGRARGVEEVVEAQRQGAAASLSFPFAASVLALVLFLLLLLHALKVELVLDCFWFSGGGEKVFVFWKEW